MEQGRIIVITGSPGTGKSTVSAILADTSDFAIRERIASGELLL